MGNISKKVWVLSLLISIIIGILFLPYNYKTAYWFGRILTPSILLWIGFLMIYSNHISKSNRKWYMDILWALLIYNFIVEVTSY